MVDYLTALAVKMMAAGMRLGEAFRRRHGDFVLAEQQADGGFTGRMKRPSDPYYTSFGLRTLLTLGVQDAESGRRLTAWLGGNAGRAETFTPVDFLTFLTTARSVEMLTGERILPAGDACVEIVRRKLTPLARPDGMFAKTARSGAGSVYQTFLTLTALVLLGPEFLAAVTRLEDARERRRLAESLLARQQADGGFSELPDMHASGANPTAAAVGTLQMLGELTPEVMDGCVRFFHENMMPDGGWRANPQIPVSDLLSTFTAVVTLEHLGVLNTFSLNRTADFVRTLEQNTGGFLAALPDTETDVEYTFYGVGTAAILAGGSGEPSLF